MNETNQRKWLDLGLFAIALFLFFALKSGLAFLWDAFSIPTPDVLASFPFSPSDVLAFGIALGALLWVRSVPAVRLFGEEVVLELSKVTWPERRETVMSAGIVIVMLAITSMLLFLFDFFWGTLTKGLLEF